MKQFFLMYLIIFFSIRTEGQTLTKADYLADFEQYVKYLKETHPQPFKGFANESEFDKYVDQLRLQLSAESLSLDEFPNILKKITIHLRDGHTWVKGDVKTQNASKRVLPLKLGIAQDSLFISSVFQKDLTNLLGCKVLAVNKESIQSIIKKYIEIEPKENYFDSLKLIQDSLFWYDAQKKYLGQDSNQLKLNCLGVDGRNMSQTISFINADLIDAKAEVTFQHSSLPQRFLESQFLDPNSNIAYLNFPSIMGKEAFEVAQVMGISDLEVKEQAGWFFKKIMAMPVPDSVAEIIKVTPSFTENMYQLLQNMKAKKSKYLVIDLRNNTGGMTPMIFPVLYMLYGDDYFNTNYPAQYKTKLSPLYLEKFGKTIDQINKENGTNYKIGDFMIEKEKTTVAKLKRENFIAMLKKQNSQYSFLSYIESLDGKAIYTPQLVFLVSPTTFSAAYHFMYYASFLGAKTIGVSSRQAGNTFMESTFFQLSKTKLKGSISNAVQILFPNDAAKGEVWLPDYAMDWELYKKYNFSDAEVKYLHDLIAAKKI